MDSVASRTAVVAILDALAAGAPPSGDVLLLESGDVLLLESGDALLLE